jgi:hypothetical protein
VPHPQLHHHAQNGGLQYQAYRQILFASAGQKLLDDYVDAQSENLAVTHLPRTNWPLATMIRY